MLRSRRVLRGTCPSVVSFVRSSGVELHCPVVWTETHDGVDENYEVDKTRLR